MTDQYESGRGVGVVAGLDDVSVDGAGTGSDPWAVEEVAGGAVTSDPATTSGNGSSGSTVETVKEQSAQVGQQAADTGQRVASVAKDEAQAVVSEATDKARDLLGETKTQLRDQLSTQQSALATVLRSLADELHDMAAQSGSARSSFAEGGETGSKSSTDGIAGQAVREVSARASDVASWLEQREPGDVIEDVTRFARRRPGLFLVLAGGAGLVAGRFTRGLTGASQDQSTTNVSAPAPVVAVGTYPEPTPIVHSAREAVRDGDAELVWGIAHD